MHKKIARISPFVDIKLSIRAYARDVKGGYVSGKLDIEVPAPPLDRIVFVEPVDKVYTNTIVNFKAEVFDKK